MRGVAAALAVAASAAVSAPFLPAQEAGGTGQLMGLVIDDATGRPVAGARITVRGSRAAAVADSTGRFLLTRLPPGAATLEVVARGYGHVIESAAVTAGATVFLVFEVSPVAVLLDEIRATARAADPTRAPRRLDPDSVVAADAGARTSDLSARVPGLLIRPSATSGSLTALVYRAATSLSLGNDPVIVIDGARISAPGGRGAGIGFLDSLDPGTIDRIEILSGAAASIEYGPGSGNGVIVVHTKRGGRR